MDNPLAIAVNLVIHDNKILLIKRVKEPYVGWWSFPGGKIKKHEHITDAALRELKEETGIDAEFEGFETAFSEHIKEQGEVIYHFLVHVCKVLPTSTEVLKGKEGEVQWMDIATIERDMVIPTDMLVLKRFLEKTQKQFYEWDVEKKNGGYIFLNPDSDAFLCNIP